MGAYYLSNAINKYIFNWRNVASYIIAALQLWGIKVASFNDITVTVVIGYSVAIATLTELGNRLQLLVVVK